MMELYLNDELVDLFGDEIVAVDYAVNEIGDIQSRSGFNTIPFDLPMTNRNKLIMENAQVLISNTAIPYRRITARLQDDGIIQLLGFAVLIQVSETFKIDLYGGNTDWFKSIGDKSIQDLDLGEFNHIWRANVVRDIRANNTAWDDVVNYPNVDYGLFQAPTTIYWHNFYPGVYYKYLVYKIMKEAGFDLEGDFWINDDLFPTEFIPFCGLFKRDRKYEYRNSGEWNTPFSIPAGPSILGQFGPGDPIHINYYDLLVTNTVNSTQYNILSPSGFLTVLDKADITFTVSFDATNTEATTKNFGFNITYVDENGSFHRENLVNATTETILSGQTKSYSFTMTKSMSQTLIKFEWVMDNNPDTAVSPLSFSITGYVVDESEEDYLNIDETFNYVTVASTLPDVKQKDVLVTLFNQYCLLCSTNFQTDRVRLFTFKEVNQNIPVAKDWSSKLDLSRKPILSFVSENYGQSNKFTYAVDDSDRYLLDDPDYCTGELLIDDENLEIEAVVFESVFAPIKRQSDSLGGTIRLAWIPKWIDGNENAVTPRVGVIRYEPWPLLTMDGYSVEDPQPQIHGLPLGFKSDLLPVYYPEQAELLNRAKFIKCYLNLNAADIHTIDFSIPVYIDYFQAYFYINLISQYKVSHVESTLVELVKLQ